MARPTLRGMVLGLEELLDPWIVREVEWPSVKVEIMPLRKVDAYTTWPLAGSPPVIVLCQSLDAVGLRCALAHEIGHLEAGAPIGHYVAADERRVREATARWLLPDLHRLAFELRADMWGACERLKVTRAVLRDRLKTLTRAELMSVPRDYDMAA